MAEDRTSTANTQAESSQAQQTAKEEAATTVAPSSADETLVAASHASGASGGQETEPTLSTPNSTEPRPSDAGAVGTQVICDAEDCNTSTSPSELYMDVYGYRYDPVAGCFELRATSAGPIMLDNGAPPLCTLAFSMGQSPNGECWSFPTGCQPVGFGPVSATPANPDIPDHECLGGSSCVIDWVCEPGMVPTELDRSCEADQDCSMWQLVGPCGCTSSIVGYNMYDSRILAAHLEACVDPAVCDCLTPNPKTDSNETVVTTAGAVAECVEGQCVTRRNPSFCSDPGSCIEATGTCVVTDPVAGSCRDEDGICTRCP